MTGWEEIRGAIDAGDADQVCDLVRALDQPGRRAVAAELPGRLREMVGDAEFRLLDHKHVNPLLLAGAGTIGGAAAAATWLARTDLRPWRGSSDDSASPLHTALIEITEDRTDEWRAEVARRLTGRLRVGSDAWQLLPLWNMAAALARASGFPPPTSDGFVVGWAMSDERAPKLAEDPFLDTLVPRLFEADGVGTVLAWDKGIWMDAIVELAKAGRLDRKVLLDGLVGRFLRGGTAHNLRWFVKLHDQLAPTEEESASRLRDYVRLLPSSPPNVADMAHREVRRADDSERLDPALFEEAVSALLFRPEKKLVRATLTWMDRTARKRDRVDATLRALPALFTTDALDLRERAVKVAAKHAGKAGPEVREEIRGAAVDLPADLRELMAAAFGAVAVPDEAPIVVPAAPPPFVPRELPAPVGSPSELAEAFAGMVTGELSWIDAERVLAGLVEFAFRDPDGTRAALQRVVTDTHPWIMDANVEHVFDYDERGWAAYTVRSLLVPRTGRKVFDALASFRKGRKWHGGKEPVMYRFLRWRVREIASLAGKVPVLLATPTAGSGHLDPGELVTRLERLERADAEPGPADLAQALLRVPREIDDDAVARARGLTSKAGRTAASWLAAGGLPDPVVECQIVEKPLVQHYGHTVRPPSGFLTSVVLTADAPSDISRLCVLPEDGHWEFSRYHSYPRAAHWWPAILPSHREVAAAHLLPYTIVDVGLDGATVLGLAESDGPADAATATVLAVALAGREAPERATAVDALLAFSGRGQLPADELGAALGRLAALGRVKLNRITKALTEAADAGAGTDIWTVIAAALPVLLPEPGERPVSGLPDLLALGTRTAEATGTRTHIPELVAVAGRGGSSRLVKEAARLHRTLTTPRPRARNR